MGRTGGKSNTRSGTSTTGLATKNLKLTIIFAPCSRSELLDIYNPMEFPTVDKEMRVISQQVESSGDYVPAVQDKVIYINCSSITGVAPPVGPPVFFPESMMDKLERAVQLVHELLDYWHGYKGTVHTTFCCYQPLEDLMVALQSILGCPGSISAQDADFSADASFIFSDSFDRYKQWTFVNIHSSVYKAEYKYESYNGKSEAENLKAENERLINEIEDERARQKFREYQDAEYDTMYKTTTRYGLEGFVKYHPEYSTQLNALDKNNNRLKEIEKEEKEFAEEWSHKSEAERKGYVKGQLDKQYDPQIQAVGNKYQTSLNEIQAKMRQLDYQQDNTSAYAWRDEDKIQRAQNAYDIGQDLHDGEYSNEFHSRDTIEYNGEYYTKEELADMYVKMKRHMEITKKNLEDKKEQAWRKARDDIHKQVYIETVNAGVAIFGIVAIVFAPLAIVDIIVVVGKMATMEEERSWSNVLALGLDIFALVPFVGAAFKLGGIAGKLSHVAVSETIMKDIAGDISSDLMAAANKERKIANSFYTKAAKADQQGYKLQDAAIRANKAERYSRGTKLQNKASNSWKKAGNHAEDGLHHQAEAEFQDMLVDMNVRESSKTASQLIENAPTMFGSKGEVIDTLPVISLGGYLNDINLYIKQFSNMSKGARAQAAGNIIVQTVGHGGNVKSLYDNMSTLANGKAYTVQSNGDDFIVVVKN